MHFTPTTSRTSRTSREISSPAPPGTGPLLRGADIPHAKFAKSAKDQIETATAEVEKTGKEILNTSFAIHSHFGSGLLEKAYRIVLATELRKRGHSVEEEKSCGFSYNGIKYENMFRVDLLVDNAIIVELKSVCRQEPVFAKQCLTYLRLLDKRLGYVINFGMASLKDGIDRVANGLPS